MDERELKTSVGQRIAISIIAVLMLGSIIASYAAIIINGGNEPGQQAQTTPITEEKLMEYEAAYQAELAEFQAKTQGDFEKLSQFRKEVVAYNETAASAGGLAMRDLAIGTGRELGENDSNYMAYYIGWCANERIFDSSFDDNQNPTGLAKILDAAAAPQLIEGWKLGIIGMKMDGIREITMPPELAYKEGGENVCGSYKPLKFIVMIKERSADLLDAVNELGEASIRLQYAEYGIDYDAEM